MYASRNYRIQRISQEMHKKISIILQHRIDDVRIGRATVSEVKVSKDLKNASVFVTFIDKYKKEEVDAAILVLQHAARFIRFLLANTIYLRIVPILLFKYDCSLVEGTKVCDLITVVQEKQYDRCNIKLGSYRIV